MRAIRNFFHNINDILLALIIVAIAVGVIYWRMNIILDYPRQLAEEQAVYQQGEQEESEDAEAAEDDGEDTDAAEDGDGSEDSSAEDAADDTAMEPQG